MSVCMYVRNAYTELSIKIMGVSVVDWSKGFKPERKTNWDDIANAIHDTVTMQEVVAKYAPTLRPRYNRIPCPIHNGKDYNFSYSKHGYKCFVCGASGDVITFVKEVCELSTRVDAMKQIDRDFNLHLIEDGDLRVSVDLLSRLNSARLKHESQQAEIDAWEKQYADLTSCFAYLDTILMHPEEHPVSVTAKAKEKMAWVRWELDHMPQRPRE